MGGACAEEPDGLSPSVGVMLSLTEGVVSLGSPLYRHRRAVLRRSKPSLWLAQRTRWFCLSVCHSSRTVARP